MFQHFVPFGILWVFAWFFAHPTGAPTPLDRALTYPEARQAGRLVAEARFVERVNALGGRRAVWVREVTLEPRGEGWFSLLVNGERLSLEDTYLEYRGRTVSLGALFSLGGRVPAGPRVWALDDGR